jgi:hypothetical protein
MNDLETLEDVRGFADYLGELVLDCPAQVIALVSEKLPEVEPIGPCAVVELLGMRGSAQRELGHLDKAREDFDLAGATCSCRECRTRTMRRRALLVMLQGEHEQARQLAYDAVIGCALGGLYGIHYLATLQRLCFYLMASGSNCNWIEAHQLLSAAWPNLRIIQARILKLKARWVFALVEIELGFTSLARGRVRIAQVLRELLGIGLPVHISHAKVEKERSERAKRRALYDVAALTSDVALLGGSHEIVAQGAKEALGILADGEASDRGLHEALADLCSASEQGDDVRAPALRLRELCPGAPPLPPSLETAA